MRRALRVVVLATGLLVFAAAPVSADAAGPSDFRSEVTGIVPAVEGLEAAIRGGDSFLELTVEGGITVIVQGYQGEPYLRFQPDGTVERNRLSTATYINDDRQGNAAIPPDAQGVDADTPPDWERIADGGSYAWHDHRTHWMDEASPEVDRGERVGGAYDPWVVPIVVDGAPVEIRGTLTYEHSVSPLPYVALALVVGVAIAFYLPRSDPRWSAALLVASAALAVVVGWFEYRETPDGGGNPLLWALAALALLAAVLALLLGRRPSAAIAALASVAALLGWAIFRIQVLLKPVLPTELPFWLDRSAVALAIGVGVSVAYRVVTSGALALPELPDDERDE